MTGLSIEIASSWRELQGIENEWLDLLERSEADEPTLTPSWLGRWWDTFGDMDGRKLCALVLRHHGRLVGIAPLVQRRHWYRPGIPFRRIELVGSGEAEKDEICSEYIGVISERGRELDVARSLCTALQSGALGAWDEVLMPAMNGETSFPSLLSEELKHRGIAATCGISSVAPYITLPPCWEDYLARLPQSRRYFVKRSIRDFERWADGTLQFEHAATDADVERGLRILVDLHERRWQRTGKDGVFASAPFMQFHRALLPELLRKGALDLCWMTVRGEPVAALYNIIHSRKVYFYQSGRSPDSDAGLRPGVVLHAHAIRRAIESNLKEYDFLAGASRYKVQLALCTRPIVSLRAARPSWVEAVRSIAERGAVHFRALQSAAKNRENARIRANTAP